MVEKDFKHIVRISNTDLDGNKPISQALRKIYGVGHNFANAICISLEIEKTKKTGTLSNEEIKKIQELIDNPKILPAWLLNRRKDYETGQNMHLVTGKLKFQKQMDIKRLQKIKSYRGMRHSFGLPVRGQRTRAHFRKSGKAMGVKKSKKRKAGK
jgi:small subunit ribosomal protein S13